MADRLYRVEAHYPEQVSALGREWVTIVEDARGYCQGWMHACCEDIPHRAFRIVRCSDGRVVEEREANDRARLGAGVGVPSVATYARAAERAVRDAAKRHDLTPEQAGAVVRALDALEVLRG